MNKKRLGMGLAALIPNKTETRVCSMKEEINEKLELQNDSKDGYLELSIDLIHPNQNQPRKFFDEKILNELAESIKKNGIIQPIIVKRDGEKYQIIAGERRFKAAKIVGLEKIPSLIKDLSEKTSLEVAIIENIQREDLNAIEESLAYKKLAEEFSYTHEEIANIIGKSRSHITNHFRILALPEKVKRYLEDGIITMGHAKVLVNVENCEKFADEIVEKSLNVRQTENLIKAKEHSENKKKEKKSDEIKRLEKKLSENLGMKVIITDDNDKYGTVKVMYTNLSELENILKRLS